MCELRWPLSSSDRDHFMGLDSSAVSLSCITCVTSLKPTSNSDSQLGASEDTHVSTKDTLTFLNPDVGRTIDETYGNKMKSKEGRNV